MNLTLIVLILTSVTYSAGSYWEFADNHLASGFPAAGRPLVDLRLPPEVDHIDAAFVWGYNRRAYLVSGYAYWRMADDGRSVVTHDYPRDMTIWAGVPIPLSDAFSYTDGKYI